MITASKRLPLSVSALASVLLLTACGGAGDATDSRTAGASAAPTAAGLACDRQCLLDAANAYIAAMVAHDPSQAPLADDLVFVENVTRMEPGEGLWASIVEGPDRFQIHVPDEVNQSVGYLAMMTYMAAPPAPQGMSPEERAAFAAEAEPVEQPVE